MAEQPFKKFTSSEVHSSNSTPIPIADSTTVLVGTRVNKADTLAGDVYMYDTVNETNFWMRPAIFTNNKGWEIFETPQFEPIAVVAIPASHNVYDNGDVGMVSLNYMRYSTPETGGNAQGICWGYSSKDLSLPNLNQVPIYSNTSSTTLTPNDIGYSPSDMFTNLRFEGDGQDTTGGYYNTSYDCIPSPYTQDGIGRNSNYYTTTVNGTDIANALSDFNGEGNTDTIIAATKVDWSGTITNSSSAGNYPAACCCRRYHKGNTSAGDWYLPAAGEGGYLIARLAKINQALTKLNVFDNSCVLVSTSANHWLSTESSISTARSLSTTYGYQSIYGKDNNAYVRGWLRA